MLTFILSREIGQYVIKIVFFFLCVVKKLLEFPDTFSKSTVVLFGVYTPLYFHSSRRETILFSCIIISLEITYYLQQPVPDVAVGMHPLAILSVLGYMVG